MSVQEVKSGAAGARKFPGWDSRRYNYFEPKGRKATHYEDMTVDVQPDPERYLLQDWILSFADGTPIKLPAVTPKLSETPGETKWLGPSLGEHNGEVLSGLGYDEASIAALKAERVI